MSRAAIFLFLAVPDLGQCWQLYLGGALFLIPLVLKLARNRFPSSPTLYAMMPKGLVKTVLLVAIGVLVGTFLLGQFHNHREFIRDSFVVLALPEFVLSILEQFGRDGPKRQLGWGYQIAGTFVLLIGILLVFGVITA